jgi:copper chaperone CopZ
MNKLVAVWFGLALASSAIAAESGAVAEVEIKNMVCPICARSVGERLSKLPGVQDVKISLKTDTARLVMAPGHKPDAEQIRKAVTEAGFEAGAITLPTAGQKAQ